ncbi:glycosyltransferase family 2 protein [Pseudomonas sp. DE0157]|uniref:glycosyltransferase n=1 Tax=Pseudomonas sp. DE0157 TaxID=2584952 RepID=UPI00119DEA32
MDIFHRHRQAGESERTDRVLNQALQVTEHRPEALLWKGISALSNDPKLAFLFLANAAQLLPDRADVQALAGRALLAQGRSDLATRFLTLAWQRLPTDTTLKMLLWQARGESEPADTLHSMILTQLPQITAPKELAQVLRLLADQLEVPSTVGVVHYLEDLGEIQGWAVDLRNLQEPVVLKIEAGDKKVEAVANIPHPLLKAAGVSAIHGGLRIRVPHGTDAVHVRFANATQLLGSPVIAMPSFVPPLHPIMNHREQPVDILIPVYNGLHETLECIDSAIKARKHNRTPHRLVVVEDATPLPGLAKALALLASKRKITLVRNSVNMGFIRTMNRAMALSPDKDVVWLNADTRVHGSWLDRLRKVAYSAEDIASVTPFTNNGELMSFPRSQLSHPMPTAAEQAELDDLAKEVDTSPVEIETGCGFCLYIKREALGQVGYLDETHLSRGYGEETDWCLRARDLGWRHMGAPNVFVAHQGGLSFGAEKIIRVAQNNAILRRRYPDASDRYKAFCLRDPIKPARDALQRARLACFANIKDQYKCSRWPKEHSYTLLVHDGTGPKSDFALVWHRDGHRTWVTVHAPISSLALELDYILPKELPKLVDCLATLPIKDLVFERNSLTPPSVCEIAKLLSAPYTIVQSDGHWQGQDPAYNWRDFYSQAEKVILPWQSWQRALTEAFPNTNSVVEPRLNRTAVTITEPKGLLIGDALNDPKNIQKWIEAGRHIMREQLPIVLLITEDSPWLKTLLDTGAVQPIPVISGFDASEIAAAIGCDAVVSLADSPGAAWPAAALAKKFDLPLYSNPHSAGIEAGANHLALLPFSLSPL